MNYVEKNICVTHQTDDKRY